MEENKHYYLGPQNGGVRNGQCGLREKFRVEKVRGERYSYKRDKVIQKAEWQMGDCGQAWESDKNYGIRRFLCGTQSEVGLAMG